MLLISRHWHPQDEDIEPVTVEDEAQAIEWLTGEYDLHHSETGYRANDGTCAMTFIDKDGHTLEFGLLAEIVEGAR